MVDGGGSYRKKNGERMRCKVLHKVLDYKQRNGFSVEDYKGKELVIVADGTGVSPVHGVISYFGEHADQRKGMTIITGFKSEKDILFRSDFEIWRNQMNVILTLDSGEETEHHKIGLVTKYIPDLVLEDASRAAAIVVGPSRQDALLRQGPAGAGFPGGKHLDLP